MKVIVENTQLIGKIARAVRKQQQIRQDDIGEMIGSSPRFVGEVEKGKSTAEIGRVLKLLTELGIVVELDLPCDIDLD